jgi:hypothetical protein
MVVVRLEAPPFDVTVTVCILPSLSYAKDVVGSVFVPGYATLVTRPRLSSCSTRCRFAGETCSHWLGLLPVAAAKIDDHVDVPFSVIRSRIWLGPSALPVDVRVRVNPALSAKRRSWIIARVRRVLLLRFDPLNGAPLVARVDEKPNADTGSHYRSD